MRQFPVLYDKSCRDFTDNSKKRLAWEDVAKQAGLQTGMYCILLPWFRCRRLLRRMRIKSNRKGSNLSSSTGSAILNVYNESEAYAESEAYDSASVVPIHTRSKLSSDSDSASIASVNQPLGSKA